MILLTVHWTSAEYATLQLTDEIVFQNLLYTIKFEPVANNLFADLVASSRDVIRGETLILDASSSYISNMSVSQLKAPVAVSIEADRMVFQNCGGLLIKNTPKPQNPIRRF